jgi:CCR4-NOT complex subunit CAF16
LSTVSEEAEAAIEVRGLTFAYPGEARPVLDRLDLAVPRGARCLLLGANGAGKTTLLNLLAGRHLIDDAQVRVLGRPAFSDTRLVEQVALLGGPFPLDVDLGVDELLAARPCPTAELAARRDRLVALLGVDLRWRMSRVSDGQRRRVQILLSLLAPKRVLLLDEVTTDLDVIARGDLLQLLREESERGCTLLYATHILDGLDAWASHLALLHRGRAEMMAPIGEVLELHELARRGVASPLLRLVEKWLRAGP